METISKDVSNATEQLIFIQKYGVERPSYHGGKYDGTGLRKLWISGYDIFKDVSEYILNNVNESERCSNQEVHRMCDLFGRGFILLDMVLRKIRYPNHKWVTHDYIDLKNKISHLQKYWYNMNLSQTPKFHALTKHSYDQIVRFNGTADFAEDFIEKSHQDGFRNEYRTKGLVNRSLKANIHCTYEKNQSHPLVVEKLQDINSSRKRNFKNDMSEHKRRKLVDHRDQIVEYAIKMQILDPDIQMLRPKEMKQKDYLKK